MCRLTFYLGPPIRLSSLLIDPDHSLIRQSTHARERDEPLNGDGFGVGWYAPQLCEEPAVFRSITPAWNNRNLHNLARVISSGCILAHVRAATQSSGVNEANCHPFRFGRHLFMHNGDVAQFARVRRRILEGVCDEAYNNVYGSTDSEHVFAVMIDELLRRKDGPQAPELRLARALQAAIARVVETCDASGIAEASYLNLAVSDGEHGVVCRYSSRSDCRPESLYYLQDPHLYLPLREEPPGDEHAILIASERLTGDAGWQEIPANHLLFFSPQRGLQLEAWDAELSRC